MIVYLDSNFVIYLVSRTTAWYPKAFARMAALRAAGDTPASGELTLAEALVWPYRHGDAALEADYESLFAGSDFTAFPVIPAVCRRAAQLRAAHTWLKLPDALHLATALENGCGLFLTADARLARCTDIAVEVLT